MLHSKFAEVLELPAEMEAGSSRVSDHGDGESKESALAKLCLHFQQVPVFFDRKERDLKILKCIVFPSLGACSTLGESAV